MRCVYWSQLSSNLAYRVIEGTRVSAEAGIRSESMSLVARRELCLSDRGNVIPSVSWHVEALTENFDFLRRVRAGRFVEVSLILYMIE